MRLKEGVYTNAQLAQWFGIGEKGFKNKKKQKLEELEEYADFHQEKGKIIITKVKKDIYKKPRSENYRKVKYGVDKYWPEDGIATCPQVSNIIQDKMELSIADSTRLKMVYDAKRELFGTNDGIWAGEKGYCRYAYGVFDEGEGRYRALTEEEEVVRHEVWDKYYGHLMEDAFNLIISGAIDEDMTMKEVVERVSKDGNRYREYVSEMNSKVGDLAIMTKVVRKMELEGEVGEGNSYNWD